MLWMNGLSEFLKGKIKIPMPRAEKAIRSTIRGSESTITNLYSKLPEVYAAFDTGTCKEISLKQMGKEKLIKRGKSSFPPGALPVIWKTY